MRRTLAVATAVASRNLNRAFTNPMLILPSVLFPLFFFAAFAGGLSAVAGVGEFDYPPGYTTFQYGFVLMQAAAFQGVFVSGFTLAADFDSGWIRRLLIAAPRHAGIVLGYMLAALVRCTLVVALVTAIAIATGLDVLGSPLDMVALYALALLVHLGASLFAASVALRLRTVQAGPAMQMPVFIALFLAPVYVPQELLTGWIETVAEFNPFTLYLNVDRALLAGEATTYFAAVGVAAGLMLVFGVLALGGLRSAERAGA